MYSEMNYIKEEIDRNNIIMKFDHFEVIAINPDKCQLMLKANSEVTAGDLNGAIETKIIFNIPTNTKIDFDRFKEICNKLEFIKASGSIPTNKTIEGHLNDNLSK